MAVIRHVEHKYLLTLYCGALGGGNNSLSIITAFLIGTVGLSFSSMNSKNSSSQSSVVTTMVGGGGLSESFSPFRRSSLLF